jgi:NADH:ubiquinone oxidoreductase subunit 2 (subunit N)
MIFFFTCLGSTPGLINYLVIYLLTVGLIMRIQSGFLIPLLFFSVAGLPPFIGFFMKLDLVYDLLEFGDIGLWLLIIFLASSLILTANYLGISLSHNYLSRKTFG